MALFPQDNIQETPLLFSPSENLPVSRNSQQQNKTTAYLATLAELRNKVTTENFASIFDRHNEDLNNGQEDALRTKQDGYRKNRTLTDLNQTNQQDIFSGNFNYDVYAKREQVINNTFDSNSVESEGITQAQEMAAQDPFQFDLMQKNLDSLDATKLQMTKMAIWNREVDASRERLKSQGTSEDVADIWTSFAEEATFIPAINRLFNLKEPLVPGTNLSVFMTPAEKWRRQRETLWSIADPKEFETITKEILKRIEEQSSILGIGKLRVINRSVMETMLSELSGMNGRDNLRSNVFGILDVAAVASIAAPGVVRGLKTVSRIAKSNAFDVERVLKSVEDITPDRPFSTQLELNFPERSAAELRQLELDLKGPIQLSDTDLEAMSTALKNKYGIAPQDAADIGLTPGLPSSESRRVMAVARDELQQDELRLGVGVAKRVGKKGPKGTATFPAQGELPLTGGATQQDLPFALMARATRDPITMSKVLGDTETSTTMAATSLMSENSSSVSGLSKLVEPVNAVVASLPSSSVPSTLDLIRPYIGDGGRIANKIDRLRKASEAVTTVTPERLGPGQLQEAMARELEKVKVQYSDTTIMDMKEVIDPVTKIRSRHLYLSDEFGQGFPDKAAAIVNAERRGILLENGNEVVQGIDNQWLIKVKSNVSETGIATPELTKETMGGRPKGLFGRYIASASHAAADIIGEARHLSTGAKAQLQKFKFKPFLDVIRKLSRTQSNDLDKVLFESRQQRKWFNVSELVDNYKALRGKTPAQKEIEAYYAAKELNDMEFNIRNDKLFVERARDGQKTITIDDPATGFSTGRTNGKVVDNPDFNELRIFDLEEGVSKKAGSETAKLQEKMGTGNYKVILLMGDQSHNFDGEQLFYVLTPKANVKEGPLAYQQLSYVAGGHTDYTYKWFVKQANSGKFKDGEEFWKTPLTHVNGWSKKTLTKWAEDMDKARLAYKALRAGKIDEAAARAIISRTPAGSLEKIQDMVAAREISLDHPFEVMYDRERPTAMTNVGNRSIYIDASNDGMAEYFNTSGRMYYSHKGEPLRGPDESLAETLSPLRMLQKSIANSIQTKAFSDYNTRVIEDWVRAASPYMNTESLASNKTPTQLFFNGALDTSQRATNRNLYQALETNRAIIKRFLGTQSPELSAKEHAILNLQEFLDGKTGLGNWAAKESYSLLDKNPTHALRRAVFDAFMAWDPGQMFVQMQTAFGIAFAAPKRGFPAVASYPLLKLLSINRSPALLDYIAKNFRLVHNFEPKEFKNMFKGFMKSGWNDPNADLTLLDYNTASIGQHMAFKFIRGARQVGRFLPMEAERANRMTAWQIAWKEMREKYPSANINDPEFLGKVDLRTSDYSMNMRNADQAFWQRGVLSFPTQFMPYQMRLLENMLGVNPRFTPAQRFGLLAGQIALYGTAGFPGATPLYHYLQDQVENATGKRPSPEEIKILTRGFWDWLFRTASEGEVDTDFASRVGIGEGWNQYVRGLMNGDLNTFVGVAGGASLSFYNDAWKSVDRVLQYARAMHNDVLNTEGWKHIANDLALNMKGYSRAVKAVVIWRTGQLVNPKTGVRVTDATALEGFAAALGIPLSEETERYGLLSDNASLQQEIREQAQLVAKLNSNFFEAMAEANETKMKETQNLITGVMELYRNNPAMSTNIANEAWKINGFTDDYITNVREKYEKLTGKTAPLTENK